MPGVKIYLVEDDPITLLDMERMLDEMGYQLAGAAADADTALKEIAQRNIDLVLMDINIKGRLNGIEAAKLVIDMDIPVIFLTGLEERQVFQAARAVSMYGYLVKPVNQLTLQSSIDSVIIQTQKHHVPSRAINTFQEQKYLSETFFFKSADKYIRTPISDILIVQADGNYSIVYTSKRKFAVKSPLKEMKLKLSSLLFVQVHRSYIVQIPKIDSIDAANLTININGMDVPIGKSYRAELMDRLNKF